MFGINFLTSFLLATLSSSPRDVAFQKWCSTVGITTPLAKLETTPRSVAGRGVFASADIEEGDVVITIPEDIVLHEFNAAVSFPALAQKLCTAKTRFHEVQNGRQSWWSRFTRHRKQSEHIFTDSSDLWQGTLTAFSLASLANESHPWYPWVSQWRRSDPVQALFEKGVTWRDEGEIQSCVEELSMMLPEVSKIKLRAAVEIRLGRLEELRTIFDLNDEASSMFGLLTSRAIDLGDEVLGVLPMFDMINHSSEPNLALSFGDDKFSMWALRDIAQGEELFVSYKDCNDESTEWDEDDAIWMLVQWGIPIRRLNLGASLSTKNTETQLMSVA